MAKPIILFLPGSFVHISVYQPIFDAVSGAGYVIKGIHPPSIGPASREGRDGPGPNMYDDAAVIAAEVEKLADQGKDVIIIGHSYGGGPVSQSTKGLSKEERKAQGKAGGVVRLGYMTAVVPGIGQSSQNVLEGTRKEGDMPMSVDANGWVLQEDPAKTARFVAQNLPPDQGEAVVRAFAKHSGASFGTELTHEGYKDIPVSYLFCEDDLCVPPGVQRAGIDMIERVSGRKVDVTSITSDHCPMLSAEKETVDWVLDLASKA
ncbi:uncharacterized protein LTR77_000826 [Saxophila tyrrhenica]|uniref:AB hydrolase-1 domain-containing protein n=1 Tax=Saxophila tyrrhenica TaxID=1690608 RepID=A0AAV9PRZ7_9PEZI|nr:hypothetical protein LTR77_000826 [Saxophila tyrrhenica]